MKIYILRVGNQYYDGGIDCPETRLCPNIEIANGFWIDKGKMSNDLSGSLEFILDRYESVDILRLSDKFYQKTVWVRTITQQEWTYIKLKGTIQI